MLTADDFIGLITAFIANSGEISDVLVHNGFGDKQQNWHEVCEGLNDAKTMFSDMSHFMKDATISEKRRAEIIQRMLRIIDQQIDKGALFTRNLLAQVKGAKFRDNSDQELDDGGSRYDGFLQPSEQFDLGEPELLPLVESMDSDMRELRREFQVYKKNNEARFKIRNEDEHGKSA